MTIPTIGLSGCDRQTPEPTTASVSSRRDVPLRVAFVGRQRDSESIQRNWASVASVELDMNHLDSEAAALGALTPQVIAAAETSDAMIVPMVLIADLYASRSITELTEAWTESLQASLGSLWPAVRNGAATYAAERHAVPLGCPLAAVLTEAESPDMPDWSAYDAAVADQNGKAAEPLAEGYCAESFLRRVSGDVDRNWLFDRDSFQPMIDQPVYVKALELMLKTASRYRSPDLSTLEVGRKIAAGELTLGIGIPDSEATGAASLDVRDLPRGSGADVTDVDAESTTDPSLRSASVGPLLLPPMTLVGVLGSACRQTATAQRFLGWLSGGEGITAVWNGSIDLGQTRTTPTDLFGVQEQGSPYAQWRRDQLSRTTVRPTTQLLQGGSYYEILDDALRSCLSSDGDAEACLSRVADRWQRLTESIGIEKQQRAWRRTLGRSV